MQVHVFENISSQFGFTDDATGAKLPARSGPWKHVKNLDLNPGEEHHGVKSDGILSSISMGTSSAGRAGRSMRFKHKPSSR